MLVKIVQIQSLLIFYTRKNFPLKWCVVPGTFFFYLVCNMGLLPLGKHIIYVVGCENRDHFAFVQMAIFCHFKPRPQEPQASDLVSEQFGSYTS